MGSQQSTTISILAQDAEFDDIFAKHSLKEHPFIHYLIGDKEKFEGDALQAKQSLLKFMNMPPIDETPTLFTNGNGCSTSDDIKTFTEIVKEDLKPIVNTEGFTIQLVLTGQCAPLVNIIGNLIRDEYVTPVKVEIFVVNGKHNGQGLFKELLYLENVTHNRTITLVIHEFNAFGSMGTNAKKWVGDQKFIECCTSDDFNKKVFELAESGNEFANGVIQYAIKFNKSLIVETVKKINDAIKTFNELNVDHDLVSVAFDVDSYINDLFQKQIPDVSDDYKEETYKLNIELCQRLSSDLYKIVKVTEDELEKKRKETETERNERKSKLYCIQGWFKVKANITRCNLVSFPLHDLSVVLMYDLHPSLSEFVSYGVEMGEFFDIIREDPECPNVEVIHYVSYNPEATRKVIEDMIINMIEMK